MKVYCAGNITTNDWRANLIAPTALEQSPTLTWPIVSTTIPDVLYTGPYAHTCSVECEPHAAEHATLDKTQREMAIAVADVVFLWIMYNDPVGDLATEIGIARGMRKTHIWVMTDHIVPIPWVQHIATRTSFVVNVDPIAALTHMINTPVARKGFTFPKASSFGNRDVNGEL